MIPNIEAIIQNAMRSRLQPPDPTKIALAGQPNVPRETSAPDPLESQLMALLQEKQSNPIQLYQPPMPQSSNERDVGGRSFLSGLVGGFNHMGGERGNDRAQKIRETLLGIESSQRGARLSSARVERPGSTPPARLGTARPPMAVKEDPYADLKREKYEAQIDATKALAERRRRASATGKRAGSGAPKKGGDGASSKDISSPTSQYYRNIGEQLKAALPDNAEYPKKRDEIDAWVAKQVQTAQINEVARRKGLSQGEAQTGGEVKPSENPNLTPEQRAYWKAKGY